MDGDNSAGFGSKLLQSSSIVKALIWHQCMGLKVCDSSTSSGFNIKAVLKSGLLLDPTLRGRLSVESKIDRSVHHCLDWALTQSGGVGWGGVGLRHTAPDTSWIGENRPRGLGWCVYWHNRQQPASCPSDESMIPKWLTHQIYIEWLCNSEHAATTLTSAHPTSRFLIFAFETRTTNFCVRKLAAEFEGVKNNDKVSS